MHLWIAITAWLSALAYLVLAVHLAFGTANQPAIWWLRVVVLLALLQTLGTITYIDVFPVEWNWPVALSGLSAVLGCIAINVLAHVINKEERA